MAPYSSRGPTDDGRPKPDLAAPTDIYHTIKPNLRVKEVEVEVGKAGHRHKQRFILGFNPDEARREKSRRLHLLKTLQEKIDALPRAKDPSKARAAILADRKRSPYLWRPEKKKRRQTPEEATGQQKASSDHAKKKEVLYPLRIDWSKVRQAARYDGKHVIQTSAPLDRDDVARAYRDLQRLERCFKHLKSAAIRVRPVWHWRDRRIQAHVLVCILALVIERAIQRRLDDAGVDFEVPRALEELARIRAAEGSLQGRRFRVRTEPTSEAAEILSACGVRLPPRVEELVGGEVAL